MFISNNTIHVHCYASNYIVGTLGPLNDITNWSTFANDLARLKGNGHTYISCDLWWQKIEGTADQTFTWSYYQTMASYISASGLKWIPILSTHTSSAYSLPSWLNQPNSQSYTSIYQTPCGPTCSDYVLTPWYNVNGKTAYTQYQELYT
jgi:beta-amylase